MKKRAWMISSVVVVLIAVASVAGIAAGGFPESKKKTETPAKPDYIVERKDAQSEKTLQIADEPAKKLTYTETDVFNPENPIDTYVDENNEKYRMNEQGDLVGYYYNSKKYTPKVDEETGEDIELSRDEMIETAAAHAQKMYGDIFDYYTLHEVFLGEGGMKSGSVDFAIFYGKDNCIMGPFISVDLERDGTVISSSVVRKGIEETFDKSLLADFTKEKLSAFAEEKAKEQYGDRLKACDLNSIRFVRENGEYQLYVMPSVTLQSDHADHNYTEKELYYYPISFDGIS